MNVHNRCPRCRHREPEDIAAEFLNLINGAMKECREDAELIAWAYYTGHPKWVIRTIPKLDQVEKMIREEMPEADSLSQRRRPGS